MKEEETALCLEDVVQFELPPLFRHQHLNRDVVIGLIGERGGGKSVGGSLITVVDYMLQGEPCWSNVEIKAVIDVDDATAAKYGLKGGQAVFKSKPLDKSKFLSFDPEYQGGVFFTHEINIWLADARRSMSNMNLIADDIAQELRKLRSAWIYDCIHEMFVDVRIRDFTDIFIQTRDTALTPEGMAKKQPQGVDFEWFIYPMTGKLNGERYADTGRRIGPVHVRGKQLWGILDTYQRARRERYKTKIGESPVNLEMEESSEIIEGLNKWGWLYEKLKGLHDEGYTEMHSEELWEYLQLKERGLTPSQVAKQLAAMNIRRCRDGPKGVGGQYYTIDKFDLKKGDVKTGKEAVLASSRR